MEFIADVLLISGAAGAAFYCIVLSRRLKRFNDLEKGVGGAIAVMSSQVDDMTKTLESAQSAAVGSNESLIGLTKRAEDVAKRLEILVASMHDLPPTPDGSEDALKSSSKSGNSDAQSESGNEKEDNMAFRSARTSPESVAA